MFRYDVNIEIVMHILYDDIIPTYYLVHINNINKLYKYSINKLIWMIENHRAVTINLYVLYRQVYIQLQQ